MRTTLDLDDQILPALKDLARRQNQSLGQVVSDLARRALPSNDLPLTRNGVKLFPAATGRQSDLETVNALRDDA